MNKEQTALQGRLDKELLVVDQKISRQRDKMNAEIVAYNDLVATQAVLLAAATASRDRMVGAQP